MLHRLGSIKKQLSRLITTLETSMKSLKMWVSLLEKCLFVFISPSERYSLDEQGSFIAGTHRKTNNHSHFQFRIPIWAHVLWTVEGSVNKQRESMQTPHSKAPGPGVEPVTFLLWHRGFPDRWERALHWAKQERFRATDTRGVSVTFSISWSLRIFTSD